MSLWEEFLLFGKMNDPDFQMNLRCDSTADLALKFLIQRLEVLEKRLNKLENKGGNPG